MAKNEKNYILKHTPDGFKLLNESDSAKSLAEMDKVAAPPELTVIRTPRWSHWYQRKLARPWQATLLGMNIEPTVESRRALQAHDTERFQLYVDRLDITKTLIGYEIGFSEDHLREGEGAGNKYLELVEYYEYATKLNWIGLEAMRTGLMIDESPPTLNIKQRQVNNYLAMLDTMFQNSVGDYFNDKGQRSPAAVLNWLTKKEAVCPIQEPTLRSWLRDMTELDEKIKGKASKGLKT